tara:strand:+ start:371 stop:532 length:162 start_codon:yes stop_codon:yes gene_type:complete
MILAQDMKLYLLNAFSFMIVNLNWIEPALEILLLIITICYTLNKWWLMKKSKK